MLPVTTEYLFTDVDAFSFDRVLGHLAIGILVGCAVALILCFLVITFHEPHRATVSSHDTTSRSFSLLIRPELSGDVVGTVKTVR